jgi:hypothetical protein
MTPIDLRNPLKRPLMIAVFNQKLTVARTFKLKYCY